MELPFAQPILCQSVDAHSIMYYFFDSIWQEKKVFISVFADKG